MFPQRGPGIGLWLLRIAVATTLLFDQPAIAAYLPAHFVVPGIAVVALALVIGFLTPVASALVIALSFFALFHLDHVDTYFAVLSAVNAIVLLLLGPGAYSLDARLYGRRIVVLTSSDDSRIE